MVKLNPNVAKKFRYTKGRNLNMSGNSDGGLEFQSHLCRNCDFLTLNKWQAVIDYKRRLLVRYNETKKE